MRASELLLIAGTAVFAVVLGVQSTDFQYFSKQGFGPGFVPMNFAILALLLAAYLLIKARLKAEGPFLPEKISERLKAAGPAIIAAALLFGATALMHFGSVLAPLYAVMVVISLAFLGHSLVRALVLNAVTLAAIYGIFSLWLNIPVV
ncbi:tripartite tricarboxylate transporter TctB family protein [Pseudooceanicola nanhaiensis]|uniref:tripartite tricarboxylate transporter TctB family protein n=1 Tax=Pseudooceanicola nanhaiensis TaxID=375761 RepID=UPI001CD23340|nr:tripartite tricarboxylate transporter TctB family protein [Pseudooceanicola nanhaiensis]MCA0920402.1 tripartite tricarboxylate transporter TctB family protein [Pseudooceanicola nanhaiensis]